MVFVIYSGLAGYVITIYRFYLLSRYLGSRWDFELSGVKSDTGLLVSSISTVPG